MEYLKFLEEIRNPVLTKIFEFFTLGGEELVLLAVICMLYWCVNKKLAYKICFAYFVSGLTVQALKISFRVPRPWVFDPNVHPVESALGTATGYSFPSGHTQGATAFMGTMACHQRKSKIWILWLGLITGVAFSRMYLGVHTPADVIVSFLISGCLVLLVNYFLEKGSFASKRIWVCIVMILISGGVAVYSLVLFNQGTIEQHYVADCCKAAGAGLGFAIAWYIETTFINFNEKNKSVWMQILKYLIGVGVALALKSGLKLLLGDSIPIDMLRYFLLVLWAVAIYPWFIKKFF